MTLILFFTAGLALLSVYLLVLLYRCGKSLLGLGRACADFAAAFTSFVTPHVREYVRQNDIYEDPCRKRAAREKRLEIRKYRAAARARRLENAAKRWSAADFSPAPARGAEHGGQAAARAGEGR